MRSKRMAMAFAWFLFVFLLAACSGGGEPGADYSEMEANLTSDPSPVQAEQETMLIVRFQGLPDTDGAEVTFDIRIDGKPKLVDAQENGSGVYEAAFTFPQAGTYDVFIHLYDKGEHVIKLERMEVS